MKEWKESSQKIFRNEGWRKKRREGRMKRPKYEDMK